MNNTMTHITYGPDYLAVRFRYYILNKCIIIKNEKGVEIRFSFDKVNEVLALLKLQFGDAFFPLANNVVALGKGTEQHGFGTAILSVYKKNVKQAQAASYLGPILTELGILQWNQVHYNICFRLLKDMIQ